jgi:hypothetical protein
MSVHGFFDDSGHGKDHAAKFQAQAAAARLAAKAGKPNPRSARSLVRTLRTRWWPRFLAASLVLIVVGITTVSNTAAKTGLILAAAAIVFVIAMKGLSPSSDYKRERPIPPGTGGSMSG